MGLLGDGCLRWLDLTAPRARRGPLEPGCELGLGIQGQPLAGSDLSAAGRMAVRREERLLPAGAILGALRIFLICSFPKLTRTCAPHKGRGLVCLTDCCMPPCPGQSLAPAGAQGTCAA